MHSSSAYYGLLLQGANQAAALALGKLPHKTPLAPTQLPHPPGTHTNPSSSLLTLLLGPTWLSKRLSVYVNLILALVVRSCLCSCAACCMLHDALVACTAGATAAPHAAVARPLTSPQCPPGPPPQALQFVISRGEAMGLSAAWR